MCCHGPQPMGGCCHGQGGHGFTPRRFFSKEERIAELKNYIQELQKEIKVVEKRIKSMEESEGEGCCCCS